MLKLKAMPLIKTALWYQLPNIWGHDLNKFESKPFAIAPTELCFLFFCEMICEKKKLKTHPKYSHM